MRRELSKLSARTRTVTLDDGFKYAIDGDGLVVGQVRHGSPELSLVINPEIVAEVRAKLGIALASSFGSAGVSNWPARSVRFALYVARRKRRKYSRKYGKGHAPPMFVHNPAMPAVLPTKARS